MNDIEIAAEYSALHSWMKNTRKQKLIVFYKELKIIMEKEAAERSGIDISSELNSDCKDKYWLKWHSQPHQKTLNNHFFISCYRQMSCQNCLEEVDVTLIYFGKNIMKRSVQDWNLLFYHEIHFMHTILYIVHAFTLYIVHFIHCTYKHY